MDTCQMQITLSDEQTERLLLEARRFTTAEVDADCEPSGYTLEISMTAIDCWAEAIIGSRRIDLGKVNVQLIGKGARR